MELFLVEADLEKPTAYRSKSLIQVLASDLVLTQSSSFAPELKFNQVQSIIDYIPTIIISLTFPLLLRICTGIRVLYTESTAIRIDFQSCKISPIARHVASSCTVATVHDADYEVSLQPLSPNAFGSTPSRELPEHLRVHCHTCTADPIHLQSGARSRSSPRKPNEVTQVSCGQAPVCNGIVQTWYAQQRVESLIGQTRRI